MINHESVLLACRSKLEALSAATFTGSIEVNPAPQDTFERSTGSWVDDGYAPGMEIVASGFVNPDNNGTFTLKEVTAGELSVGEVSGHRVGGRRDALDRRPRGRRLREHRLRPDGRQPVLLRGLSARPDDADHGGRAGRA